MPPGQSVSWTAGDKGLFSGRSTYVRESRGHLRQKFQQQPKRVVITCKGIKWWQGPIEPLHKERSGLKTNNDNLLTRRF